MDDPISVSHALGPSSRISVPKNGQVRLDQQHQTVPQHGLRCPSSLNIFVHILLCVWGGGGGLCVWGGIVGQLVPAVHSRYVVWCLVNAQQHQYANRTNVQQHQHANRTNVQQHQHANRMNAQQHQHANKTNAQQCSNFKIVQ